jgi:hypothetical protein
MPSAGLSSMASRPQSALSQASASETPDVPFRRKRSWSVYVVLVLLVLIAIVGYLLLQDH